MGNSDSQTTSLRENRISGIAKERKYNQSISRSEENVSSANNLEHDERNQQELNDNVTDDEIVKQVRYLTRVSEHIKKWGVGESLKERRMTP